MEIFIAFAKVDGLLTAKTFYAKTGDAALRIAGSLFIEGAELISVEWLHPKY